MSKHTTQIEKIKRLHGKRKEQAIFYLWEHLWDEPLDSNDISYIRNNILSLYPSLNFDQKHAALQVLLRLHCADSVVESLVFDYLGQIYEKYIGIAFLMSNYLYVMNGFRQENGAIDIGPWELDKTFAEVRKRLKEGNSPYL